MGAKIILQAKAEAKAKEKAEAKVKNLYGNRLCSWMPSIA